MKIQEIEIERINLAPYNPRKDLIPADPEYKALERSIDQWGYVDPLIWNQRTGNLVGGHQRFKILLARGLKTMLVSVVDLDERNEKALNIALNKISGTWDFHKLSELIVGLDDGDFDPTLTGFSNIEIENMATWSSLDAANKSELLEGMPEYSHEDKTSFRYIIVHFADQDACAEFFGKIGQNFTDKTKSIWYPPQEKMDTKSRTY